MWKLTFWSWSGDLNHFAFFFQFQDGADDVLDVDFSGTGGHYTHVEVS